MPKTKDKYLFCVFLLFVFTAIGQETEIKINKYISGSLVQPASPQNPDLVIIIQGSGPTDRNGNQPNRKNNSLKMLAQGLVKSGIASFRYDKRISKMQELNLTETDLRFDDFVTDAISVIDYFEEKDNYNKIIILGHSQGSLVGMLAAKSRADAFISVAGPAQPIDSIIINQVSKQAPAMKPALRKTFTEIRKKGSTKNYPPLLAAIFRPSVQPFLYSWIHYNPSEEIANLKIPILIVNGTRDLQVGVAEAKSLKKAAPEAKLVLIEKMNHIFKKIEEPSANLASYNQPKKPLHPKPVPTLVSFIKNTN